MRSEFEGCSSVGYDVPAPAAMTDVNGTILWSNRAYQERFGFGGESRNFDFAFCGGAKVFYHTHIYPMVLRERSVREVYCKVTESSGASIPVLLNAEMAGTGEHARISWLLFIAESRGAFERELIEAKRLLERRADELNALHETKEALAQRLSNEIKAKARLYATIAHDLRSPFTPLLGMTEILKDAAAGMSVERVISYAGDIHGAALQVYRLLENLLEWAHVQSDFHSPQPAEFDLSKAAAESVDVLQPVARGKYIELLCEVPQLTVFADRHMVMLVMRNLLTNAIKFSQPNGVVRITADRLPSRRVCEVSISDNGIGMGDDILRDIFSPTIRTTKLGTSGEIGTGLGLPLSKQLVEVNGGTLTIQGKADGGTVASFSLPLRG